MARELVIGIDSSTTATKAIAWDGTGAPVAEGRAAIPLAQPRPRPLPGLGPRDALRAALVSGQLLELAQLRDGPLR